ncbi:Flagellar hook-length control protein FliK [Pelotomaculum schinkii]|uniref:Flagellar hook-length control protein FliK n=1 Tax=Pelotomaculum schinkii TaxID=78350 RepID=A0A4Y7R7K0_9FIRM|nr:flagellar hook-length control protein FliK [Pelotomaculum schinkii]TEB04938.1 Flagellar hook-length control protein FliK [Pelotomaculum schinkii]
MLTAAINDTVLSQSNGGKFVNTKLNTGEFDLVMALMQLLLMPGPSVRLQTQNESGERRVSATGPAGLDLVAPLVPEEPQKDGAELTQVVCLPGWHPPAGATVDNAGVAVQQLPQGAALSYGMQATPTAMTGQNQETVPNEAVAITGKPLQQLSITVPEQGPIILQKTGLPQAVENGVKQGSNPACEQNETAVKPAGGEIKEAVLDPQAVSRVSLVGNMFQAKQTENNHASENRVQKALVVDETVQLVGKESGANQKNAALLKTYGSEQIEPFKSGSGPEFVGAIENSLQPNTAPAGTILSTANLAESTERIPLPDLQERLAQEIKNALSTAKGEVQRQVQLKLEPEHLGQLTIKLFFNKDALSAHFYTENNYVREILEGSLHHLRDSLSQHDLRLNEAIVFAGDDGRGGGMGRSFEGRNGPAWSYRGSNDRTYADTQVEPANTLTATTGSLLVNYLI